MTTQHELVQGTDAWHQFRLEHFGASEAAAMLGLSSKVKRNELLRMKHTGVAKEFSDWVQKNILDNGHEVEALARPIAEASIGDELYPATYSEGKLSASCDGLTMDGSTAFEHKQWNVELAAAVSAGTLPDEHQPQCQQVMMVTGAKRLFFMVSDGTTDNCETMWVMLDAAWRKKILQGWAQFAEDLAGYQHVEIKPQPVAAVVVDLPAVSVQVSGHIAIRENFALFETALRDFIDNRLIRAPQTDQDFADLDAQIKTLKKAEDALNAAESNVIAQVASIDAVKRVKDMLYNLTRDNRLAAEKLLEAEKINRRRAIQEAGESAMRVHIDGLNIAIGKTYMPDQKWADFVAAMRGKKTIASLKDAVDTELACAKIAANEVADRIQVNLNSLRELASDHAFLFADTAQIVLKANDDLVALIKNRLREHKESEAARVAREQFAREMESERTSEPIKPADPINVSQPPPATVTVQHAQARPVQVPSAVFEHSAPKDIGQKALELCWEIEKLPTSEQQTKVSTMADELRRDILSYLATGQHRAA